MIEKIDRRLQIKNQDVYELVLVIPPGKVSTYGDIAKALAHPQAARLIGNILKKIQIQFMSHVIESSNQMAS